MGCPMGKNPHSVDDMGNPMGIRETPRGTTGETTPGDDAGNFAGQGRAGTIPGTSVGGEEAGELRP